MLGAGAAGAGAGRFSTPASWVGAMFVLLFALSVLAQEIESTCYDAHAPKWVLVVSFALAALVAAVAFVRRPWFGAGAAVFAVLLFGGFRVVWTRLPETARFERAGHEPVIVHGVSRGPPWRAIYVDSPVSIRATRREFPYILFPATGWGAIDSYAPPRDAVTSAWVLTGPLPASEVLQRVDGAGGLHQATATGALDENGVRLVFAPLPPAAGREPAARVYAHVFGGVPEGEEVMTLRLGPVGGAGAAVSEVKLALPRR
jgi:hypothetical protein